MPRNLPDRFQPDSIREFLAAAWQRHVDAVSLAASERRTAAVYLLGYSAEMILKAGFFRIIGFPPRQPIVIADLVYAKNLAKNWGITFRNFHDVAGWGKLVVAYRIHTPGQAYPGNGFASQLLGRVRTMDRLWRETIRYHKNVAYPLEVAQMKAAVEWLLEHSFDL